MIDFKITPVDIRVGKLTCLLCPNSKILYKNKEGDTAFSCMKQNPYEVLIIPVLTSLCPYLKEDLGEDKDGNE